MQEDELKAVSVMIEESIKVKLEGIAKEDDRSVASLIRIIVDQWLEKNG